MSSYYSQDKTENLQDGKGNRVGLAPAGCSNLSFLSLPLSYLKSTHRHTDTPTHTHSSCLYPYLCSLPSKQKCSNAQCSHHHIQSLL